MSLESIEKKNQENDFSIKVSLNLNTFIIPFSLFFTHHEDYIYTGEEKIPFELRHPKYKKILLNEFSTNLVEET
ncbi:MAG: hypothetical protein ACFFEN_08590 [Candidatus Thorarchaeota archaeon]